MFLIFILINSLYIVKFRRIWKNKPKPIRLVVKTIPQKRNTKEKTPINHKEYRRIYYTNFICLKYYSTVFVTSYPPRVIVRTSPLSKSNSTWSVYELYIS